MIQTDIYRIAFWLWMGTFAIWAIGSIVVRQTIGSHSEWRSRLSVWIIALAWGLLFTQHPPGVLAWRFVPLSAPIIYSGLALTLAGLGLALWARFFLGGNWSAQIELKRDHQLIAPARMPSSGIPSTPASCWRRSERR